MPIPINRDTGDQLVTIASGNTQSSVIAVQGFTLATLHLPAALKGNLRYRVAPTDRAFRSGNYYRLCDDVSTQIIQSTVTVGKPAAVAVRPEVMACRAFKLSMTTAQSGHKVLHLRVMG